MKKTLILSTAFACIAAETFGTDNQEYNGGGDPRAVPVTAEQPYTSSNYNPAGVPVQPAVLPDAQSSGYDQATYTGGPLPVPLQLNNGEEEGQDKEVASAADSADTDESAETNDPQQPVGRIFLDSINAITTNANNASQNMTQQVKDALTIDTSKLQAFLSPHTEIFGQLINFCQAMGGEGVGRVANDLSNDFEWGEAKDKSCHLQNANNTLILNSNKNLADLLKEVTAAVDKFESNIAHDAAKVTVAADALKEIVEKDEKFSQSGSIN